MDPTSTEDNEDVIDKNKVPSGKLASVTKKRNKISKLLDIPDPDYGKIKEEYNEYLARVESLYAACGDVHTEWLKEHKDEIESFRIRVDAIIHPSVKPKYTHPKPLSRSGSYISLRSTSTTASARYKLAEKRAQLIAREELKEKETEMRNEELKIKAMHDAELLRLQIAKENLETERMKRELKVMEEELEDAHFITLSEIEKTQKLAATPHRKESYVHDKSLGQEPISDLLTKQNEISTAIVSCQQQSFLPKKELSKFDGSDITQFKRFLINFERTIESNCPDERDKLIFLQQYTEGYAKRIVDSCVHFDSATAYHKARELLMKEYGNEFKVAQAYIFKLHNWSAIKNEDPAALDDLGIFLLECQNYMENMTAYNQLQNPNEIMHIVNKLNYRLKDRWRRKTHNLLSDHRQVSFHHLVTFVREEASVLKQPIFGTIGKTEENKTQKIRKNLSTTSNTENENNCVYCKKSNHNISDCRFFEKLSYSDKSNFVKGAKLCFACLLPNHISRTCKNKKICDTCNKKHPTIMHNEAFLTKTTDKEDIQEVLTQVQSKSCSTKESSVKTIKRKVSCPIVPAKLKIKNRPEIITVNCVLDTGSTDCWLNEGLLRKLGLRPTERNIKVSTMSGKNQLMKTKVVNNLQVLNLNNNLCATIPVTFTKAQESWPFSKEDLVTKKDINDYEHLSDLPFNFIDEDIGLLVGMNQPDLIKPLEIKDGKPGTPYGSRSLLGWSLNGTVKRKDYSVAAYRIKVKQEDLNATIESYFSQDFHDDSTDTDYSTNDKVWLQDVSLSKVILPNNHIQIDLPLKCLIELPNNRSQVYRMFLSTRDRILKQNLFANYNEFINDMINENFAEEVPQGELSSKAVWYLAHHEVFHKRKHKLRVVFNCSLKFNGISLNDCLRKGPDLTNNLLDILMRFRTGKTAVIGDIRKMFYQVRVPKHHADLMRFFWTNSSGKIVEFRLLVHVFGATSSPSVANFALKTTAESKCSKEAAKIIKEDFYVDDMLSSFPNEEDSIVKTTEVKRVLSNRGFELTSFSSNSPQVLKTLDDSSLTPEVSSLLSEETSALGIIWNMREDKLYFRAKFDDKLVTKRHVLKTLASIYDPIGIISPVIIPAKRLFQITCREKLTWDEELPASLLSTWRNWRKQMTTLPQYKIQRCTNLSLPIISTELHIFSDGSETAYGAVAFVKVTYNKDMYNVSLVASKSRLTPLNNSTLRTIPRIELCAAKLAVELAKKIKKTEAYNKLSEHYWSDSTTVLAYLKNDSLSFHRFVQNKVNYIKNFSDSEAWNYVRSSENPADIISRGATPEALKNSSLWNSGPEFLHQLVISTKAPQLPTLDTDMEIKSSVLATTTVSQAPPLDCLMESVSSWYKLKVRIASIMKLRVALYTKTRMSSEISLTDLKEAEIEIIKYLQNKVYGDELTSLAKNNSLSKNSSIRKLCPFIDKNKVMRVTGRIEQSAQSYNVKFPLILPSCAITKLLVESTHRSVGHLGREAILSTLRRKYWIVKGNSLARTVVSNCNICKKFQGKTSLTQMSNLPSERLTPDLPPFSNVAVDCFGPFIVIHGRKSEKRYGVLFSCMNSRAIHVEISHTMSTDSFIQALRRFVSRRGNVKFINSDNGTNFVGAYRELNAAIRDWNLHKIENWCKQSEIQWRFNIPYSSHHGGHFERHIRTIRKVLYSILTEQNLRLNDETLLTVMCEVEAVLNNRPLTELSSDVTDSEPLTPNHLLLLNSEITFPPGLFTKKDSFVERRWRQSQYLVDIFWKRWKREYLVLLQERQKWYSDTASHKIGDLVLVSDINLPRNHWPIGRIVNVNSDQKGVVRSAKIKISKCKNSDLNDFSTTIIERPIVKLILLRKVDDLI